MAKEPRREEFDISRIDRKVADQQTYIAQEKQQFRQEIGRFISPEWATQLVKHLKTPNPAHNGGTILGSDFFQLIVGDVEIEEEEARRDLLTETICALETESDALRLIEEPIASRAEQVAQLVIALLPRVLESDELLTDEYTYDTQELQEALLVDRIRMSILPPESPIVRPTCNPTEKARTFNWEIWGKVEERGLNTNHEQEMKVFLQLHRETRVENAHNRTLEDWVKIVEYQEALALEFIKRTAALGASEAQTRAAWTQVATDKGQPHFSQQDQESALSFAKILAAIAQDIQSLGHFSELSGIMSKYFKPEAKAGFAELMQLLYEVDLIPAQPTDEDLFLEPPEER